MDSQEGNLKSTSEVQTSKEWSYKLILKFKRVKNEAKIIFMCKWVNND